MLAMELDAVFAMPRRQRLEGKRQVGCDRGLADDTTNPPQGRDSGSTLPLFGEVKYDSKIHYPGCTLVIWWHRAALATTL